MPTFDILASAENNTYMEWQAMLFHFSCLTVQKQVPIIAVHKGPEPLLPGFELIRNHGGHIQEVDNFKNLNDVCYPPRNSAAALSITSDADFVVLCDADMIVVNQIDMDRLIVPDNTITFDYVGYLDPDRDGYQPDIDDVFVRNGISSQRIRTPVINGGVPHVIPNRLLAKISETWLRSIDEFPILFEGERPDSDDKRYSAWPYRCWLASMWAMVLVIHKLGLKHKITEIVATNHPPDWPMETERWLVHYCYPSSAFDKRTLGEGKSIQEPAFWDLEPDDGTVAGYLRKVVMEAGRYYGLRP